MRYLEGLSLAAFARGNRRMLAPFKAKHAEAAAEHAAALADLRKRRAKARQIEDLDKRAKALDELKGEQPTHPSLVAVGCAVVAAVAGWPLLHGYHTVAVSGAATLWAIVALALGQQDPAEEYVDADGAEQPDDEEPGPTVPTAADVHALTASLAAGGTSVLLTRVAAGLASQHPGWEPSTKAVRALLAEAGIPVRSGVRTPEGNGPGVHHLDAPKLLPSSAAAIGSVVCAGQQQTPTPTTPRSDQNREGYLIKPDPNGDPHRWVITHPTRQAS